MTPYIVDLETTVRNRGDGAVGTMEASPYHSENKIVLSGCMWQEGSEEKHEIRRYAEAHASEIALHIPEFLRKAITEKVLLVGHNISFDLKYIIKTWPRIWAMCRKNVYIWDTQQVAYLLSGQTHFYPSLNDLAAELGIDLKNDEIKEYWEAGIDTDKIPADKLRDYLHHDLEMTMAVFKYQYEVLRKIPRLFNLVRHKMNDILMTTIMEWNGMSFDVETAQESAIELSANISSLSKELEALALSVGWPSHIEFNPMSSQHASVVLFGGEVKSKEPKPLFNEDGSPCLFKSGVNKGKHKTRLEEVVMRVPGYGITPTGTANKSGVYSTSEEVLSAIDNSFAKKLLEIRGLEKDVETYYNGYTKLTWPNGLIHPSINHCSTRTGRQSCTQPNLQNVSRDE